MPRDAHARDNLGVPMCRLFCALERVGSRASPGPLETKQAAAAVAEPRRPPASRAAVPAPEADRASATAVPCPSSLGLPAPAVVRAGAFSRVARSLSRLGRCLLLWPGRGLPLKRDVPGFAHAPFQRLGPSQPGHMRSPRL